MPPSSTDSETLEHAIGRLCVGGDWACAHGDLSALRHVAQCLAVHTRDALRRELLGLADACSIDPDHAVERWVLVKDLLRHSSAA